MLNGFNPWIGKIPWRRERLPTPVFWPGEFHGLYSSWAHKESDVTEWLSLHFIVLLACLCLVFEFCTILWLSIIYLTSVFPQLENINFKCWVFNPFTFIGLMGMGYVWFRIFLPHCSFSFSAFLLCSVSFQSFFFFFLILASLFYGLIIQNSFGCHWFFIAFLEITVCILELSQTT